MSFIIPAAVVNIFAGSGTALVAAGAEAAVVGAAVTIEVSTLLGALGSAIGAAGAVGASVGAAGASSILGTANTILGTTSTLFGAASAAVGTAGAAVGTAGAAVGAAGAGTIVAGAGAMAASFSAGAGARYGTLRYQDLNSDLIGPDDKPLLVDETLMNSLQGQLYVFTHKAIWGCWLLLPAGGHTARDVVSKLVELPPTEHWAFVARAECKAMDPPQVAYFIAQFGNGDFIQPAEEIGRDNENAELFRALLQERNKAHAALCIVQGPSNPDVWIHSPDEGAQAGKSEIDNQELRHKRYVYKDKQLCSPEFREDEWAPMRKPMKLRELNDCIYDTKCTGRDYDAINNNCQHFSVALFNDML